MLEKYLELAIFFEYTLPFIILGAIAVLSIFCFIIVLFIDWWKKRQRKMNDRYYKKYKDKD